MAVIRRLLPQTLAARTLAALVISFAVLFAAMVALHDRLLRQAVERASEELLAHRLATVIDALDAVPQADRDGVAHGLSRPGLDVHWRQDMAAAPGHVARGEGERIAALARGISPRAMELSVRRAEDGVAGPAAAFAASARLPDGTYVEVGLGAVGMLSADLKTLHVYAAAIGMLLIVAVGLAARSVSAPLTALSDAVATLDPEKDQPPLPVRGPREVRLLSTALNAMIGRTRDAFQQRTLALAALSHDLMSPLARLRFRATELTPEDADPIQRDVAEMETMVSDVLAYLRSGHDTEAVRPVAMASIVRTVADEFAEGGAGVEERRMDDAVLEGRRVALKRAVTNLVANALRHGREPHGREPWVEVLADDGSVRVRVGDSGPGIPPEDLPRVATPFFRGDRARQSGGGSGLGLSTVKAIAEAHGGHLGIESRPGRGTVATLTLPRTRPPESARAGGLRVQAGS